jgi:hypothetical protein
VAGKPTTTSSGDRILPMTKYIIPEQLNDFQRSMYLHLCEWKSRNISDQPGSFGEKKYDVIVPGSLQQGLPHLYGPVRERFKEHQKKFPFKTHKFAGHMASSQIACANLFLPILDNPVVAAKVLRAVKPDLKSIAVEELDKGFRLEFWDQGVNRLGDHCADSGTDVDIAIAYRNQAGEVCLWLIEHKLTENEFTTCGAYRSHANQHKDACDGNAAARRGRENCYYHTAKEFNYWKITLKNKAMFPLQSLQKPESCPFKGGMNQLWRNQLMATAIEADPNGRYKKVYFSVVHHPGNMSLLPTMQAFKDLIGQKDRFFSFTSDQLRDAARVADHAGVQTWAKWYDELYFW